MLNRINTVVNKQFRVMNIKHYLILCVGKYMYPTQLNEQQALRRKAKQYEMKNKEMCYIHMDKTIY